MKYDESHLLNKLPAKTYQKDKELQGDFMLLDFFSLGSIKTSFISFRNA